MGLFNMKLIKNNVDLSQTKIHIRDIEVSKLMYRGDIIYEPNSTPYFPKSTLNFCALGDSTIAAGYGGLVVPAYIPEFTPLTSVATGGDTILGQRAKFLNLTNHLEYDAVVIQIGLNDMNPASQTTETVLANYQTLIDVVRSKVNIRCKIYISQMLPCKQRWFDLYGQTDGALALARWQELNNAIANTFTGVNGRITSHVALLGDAEGNLKPEYDSGDRIHETPEGRIVIANAWRDKLVFDGVLVNNTANPPQP